MQSSQKLKQTIRNQVREQNQHLGTSKLEDTVSDALKYAHKDMKSLTPEHLPQVSTYTSLQMLQHKGFHVNATTGCYADV